MIHENIEGFVNNLIDLTRKGKMNWMPLSFFHKMGDLNREFDSGFAGIDFGVNSIRESQSYFLKSNDGYVFLFEIYHGDPEVTSPELDTLALMVKINSAVPIYNLSANMGTKEHQESLEILKLLIEHYVDVKYSMPASLYNFMEQVLNSAEDRGHDFGDEDS